MDRHLSGALLLILAGALFSVYAYPLLPEEIATHWDAKGQVNGFSGKIFLFLVPFVSFSMVLLLWSIPKIDPRKEHIEKFGKVYKEFILVFAGFITYVHILLTGWNLGWEVDVVAFLGPAIGGIFYFTGIVLERSRSNWFIGIRTPWTLSSERVWKKTNHLGGKVFKLFGVLLAIGMLVKPEAVILPLILVILLGVFGLFVYSYLEWKKERKN